MQGTFMGREWGVKPMRPHLATAERRFVSVCDPFLNAKPTDTRFGGLSFKIPDDPSSLSRSA
jgi:hypothetical protein